MFRDILEEEDLNNKNDDIKVKKKNRKQKSSPRRNSRHVEKVDITLGNNKETNDMMSVLGFGTSTFSGEQTKKKGKKRLLDEESKVDEHRKSKKKKEKHNDDDTDSLDGVLKAIVATKETK